MNFKELEESSGSSPQGSITNDLILSKMWICEVLKHLNRKKFSTIYILGSWYGNMALILDRMGIEYKNIINVDKNKEHLDSIKSEVDSKMEELTQRISEIKDKVGAVSASKGITKLL